MVEETIAWFDGVDWGSEKHQACLLDTQGAIVGEREFPHSGKGLSELADWLACGGGGQRCTPAARLEAVIATAAMDEAACSAWCRGHGLYPSELAGWKQDAI